MISRDYTQEIGLSTGDKKIPMPVAIMALVAIAVGVWFGFAKMRAAAHVDKAQEKISAVVAPAGQTVMKR